MKRILYFAGLLVLSFGLKAQVAPSKYFAAFTDKNNSPYSLDNPLQFLSQRALDRRSAQSIPLAENDLPVNPQYIQAVTNIGVTLLNPTKWLNGMTFLCYDTNLLSQIRALPFVAGVTKCTGGGTHLADKFRQEQESMRPLGQTAFHNLKAAASYDYGGSYRQISMVNGDKLHDLGFAGQGKVVAVLDGGFSNADTLPAFDSLWANGQILGTRNFVNRYSSVFQGSPHGMEVLSIMGGNLPGQLVGTAPKASYWLLESEDVTSEYLIEEYTWVSAAEFADSAGADVINSSLGYTTFDDSTQNHTCADMDGYSTPSTIGANVAFDKGMVVVISAGNSGNSPWRCVGAPADAAGALAIAAVDSSEVRASFSSVGTNNPGILKPDIAAMGQADVVQWVDGTVVRGSGTSFASPVIAGMMATLWSALPGVAATDLVRMVEQSSTQYHTPDTLLGYGIPDFFVILGIRGTGQTADDAVTVYPNPFQDHFQVSLVSPKDRILRAELLTPEGGRVMDLEPMTVTRGENHITIPVSHTLASGFYILILTDPVDGNYLRAIKTVKVGM